jgi:transposase
MTCGKKRPKWFNSALAKAALAWGHYAIRTAVFQKSLVTDNKMVMFTNEPGTSKQCDRCGWVNRARGFSPRFVCGSESCRAAGGYSCERDTKGARANLLAAVNISQGVFADPVVVVPAVPVVNQVVVPELDEHAEEEIQMALEYMEAVHNLAV